MSTKTLVYKASTISYEVVGTGKPILLIHGFGEDSSVWQNQVNYLKPNYQLIVPDLPGSGNSQMIDDMSIEGMAELIKAIIDQEVLKHQQSIQPTIDLAIFGHSMGGYITLALIEKYPTLFSSFGLIHSSAFADNEEKIQARKKSIEFTKTNGSYEFLKSTTPNLFKSNKEEFKPIHPYCDVLIEQGKNFKDAALIAYYTAMINRRDRTSILTSYTKPILFIIGAYDLAIPFTQSMQQCHLPQQSHCTILRNSAHMGMWEEVDKTNQTLANFLLLQ